MSTRFDIFTNHMVYFSLYDLSKKKKKKKKKKHLYDTIYNLLA